MSLVGVTAHADGRSFPVAGTTIGRDERRQLVRVLDYEIDVELDRYMLFVVNDDTPGIIGRLGTILGEAQVNIANMTVSRNRQEARALMALSLDSPATDERARARWPPSRGSSRSASSSCRSRERLAARGRARRRRCCARRASSRGSRRWTRGRPRPPTPPGRSAAGSRRSSSRSSFPATTSGCSRWSPATAAPTARRSLPRPAPRRPRPPAPATSRASPATRPGGVAPFPLPGVHAVLMEQTMLSHDVVWIGAGSPRHVAALTPADLVRVSRARTVDLVSEN